MTRGRTPSSPGQRRQPADLVEGVDDDPADPGFQGGPDLRGALVVAVQTDAGGLDAGAEGHGQLAARTDVDAEALLRHPPGDGGADERLRRVVDVPVGERGSEGAGPIAEVELVDHVHGRADRGRDLVDPEPGNGEHAVGVLGRVGAPQPRQQSVHVVGSGQPAGRPGFGVGVDGSGDVGVAHGPLARHDLDPLPAVLIRALCQINLSEALVIMSWTPSGRSSWPSTAAARGGRPPWQHHRPGSGVARKRHRRRRGTTGRPRG